MWSGDGRIRYGTAQQRRADGVDFGPAEDGRPDDAPGHDLQ